MREIESIYRPDIQLGETKQQERTHQSNLIYIYIFLVVQKKSHSLFQNSREHLVHHLLNQLLIIIKKAVFDAVDGDEIFLHVLAVYPASAVHSDNYFVLNVLLQKVQHLISSLLLQNRPRLRNPKIKRNPFLQLAKQRLA